MASLYSERNRAIVAVALMVFCFSLGYFATEVFSAERAGEDSAQEYATWAFFFSVLKNNFLAAVFILFAGIASCGLLSLATVGLGAFKIGLFCHYYSHKFTVWGDLFFFFCLMA